MFQALIAEVERPLQCIQCLWVKEPLGYGIEVTAFFDGEGRYSAVLLGGVHGDGERRVLGGCCPPFLLVSAAETIGEEIALRFSAEFYFPWRGQPNDQFPSWLDVPTCERLG